jgi:hypothetical protein
METKISEMLDMRPTHFIAHNHQESFKSHTVSLLMANIILALQGAWSFFAVFSTNWLQSTLLPPYFFKVHINIILHLFLGRASGLLPSDSLATTLYKFLTHVCHMTCPSHFPWCDHLNNIWQAVQILKLLIMQLSPSSCHFCPSVPVLWAHSSRTHTVFWLPLAFYTPNSVLGWKFW